MAREEVLLHVIILGFISTVQQCTHCNFRLELCECADKNCVGLHLGYSLMIKLREYHLTIKKIYMFSYGNLSFSVY